MKFLFLLSVAYLASALAVSTAEGNEKDNIRGVRIKGRTRGKSDAAADEATRMRKLRARELGWNGWGYNGGSSSSSKGKGSKSSSSGNNNQGCYWIKLYYKNRQFRNRFDGDGIVGSNGDVPLFNSQNNKEVGTYTEVTTAVGQVECYSNGVYNLAFAEGRPTSQIFIASTCSAKQQPVVGGTGFFACASGYVKIVNRGNNNKKHRVIYICDSTCLQTFDPPQKSNRLL